MFFFLIFFFCLPLPYSAFYLSTIVENLISKFPSIIKHILIFKNYKSYIYTYLFI